MSREALLSVYAPPPRPKRESFVGKIIDGRLSLGAGCRRVLTDEEGEILSDALIPYAEMKLKAGMLLIVLSTEGEEVGIYDVKAGGLLSLKHGDAVSGACVVMEVSK
jgi:hypothetical protein